VTVVRPFSGKPAAAGLSSGAKTQTIIPGPAKKQSVVPSEVEESVQTVFNSFGLAPA
jgi:hypothetical protein